LSIIRAFQWHFPGKLLFFRETKKEIIFLRENEKTKTQNSQKRQLLSVPSLLSLVDDFEDYVFNSAVFMNFYTLLNRLYNEH